MKTTESNYADATPTNTHRWSDTWTRWEGDCYICNKCNKIVGLADVPEPDDPDYICQPLRVRAAPQDPNDIPY